MPDLLRLQPLPSPNGSLKSKSAADAPSFAGFAKVSNKWQPEKQKPFTVAPNGFLSDGWGFRLPCPMRLQVIQAGDGCVIMLIGAAAKRGGGFFILPFDVFHSGFPIPKAA